jgi:hypothetical protein
MSVLIAPNMRIDIRCIDLVGLDSSITEHADTAIAQP